jgi:hypothetical protein
VSPRESKLRLVDRTRIEVDWTCERRRYWSAEHAKRGIVPLSDAVELAYGIAIHDALASLALGLLPPEQIADILLHNLQQLPTAEPRKSELINLGLGHFWGFVRVVWPLLLRDYSILRIEKELTLPIGKDGDGTRIEMMLKPDLALERKADGTVWYPDFKSTGFKTKNWLDGWQYAQQLHAGCLALELDLGRPVEGAFVIGLYKGQEREGQLRSALTYAYLRKGLVDNGKIVQEPKWSHEYVRGWEMVPTSEYPGGVKAWVDSLPEEVLLEQFPLTGPVPLHREMAGEFLAQQELREQEILSFHRGERTLAQTFRQNFKACRPLFGEACPYREVCFSKSIAEDPIGSGHYQWRQPHHQLEVAEMES